MSVLKRFRSESKMQFYATAQKLRKDIMTLRQAPDAACERDFYA